MKNPSVEILTQASDALAAGTKMKEVLSWTFDTEDGPDHLTYSQTWLFHQRRNMDQSLFITDDPASAEGQAAIATARAANQSWGYIAVRCNRAEGAVRKAFEKVTATKSAGSRIGHGGRWINNDPVLYLDERKIVGVTIPVGTPRANFRSLVENYEQATAKLSKEELARRCRLLGLKDTGSQSVLVKRLVAATSGKAPANA